MHDMNAAKHRVIAASSLAAYSVVAGHFGIHPFFRTLLIGGKMLSEVSNGTKEIHGGVQA